MANTIKHGIQESSSKTISHGIQKPQGSEFNRRPNGAGDEKASYKFDKQSGAGPSGNAATQAKGDGKRNSTGGSSNFSPKGKTNSPNVAKGSGYMSQKNGIKGKF